MEKQLEKRLEDWLTWYNWHHSQLHNASVENRVAFLDKCVQGLFEMLVKSLEEMDRQDQRRDRPNNIILPNGVIFNADLREPGQ